MFTKKICTLAILFFGPLLFSGCEDKDSNNLAQAQKCLDETSDSNFADAENCYSYVSGLNSKTANVLKCSIKLMAAGITTSKVIDAFSALDDGTYANAEAAFMAKLAVNPATKIDAAIPLCVQSGVSSLIQIATVSRVGSSLAATIENILGTPIDVQAPGFPSSTDLQNALAACKVASPPASCSAEDTGAAIVLLSSSYCSQANPDPQVCDKVKQAITASGGNSAAIAAALYNLF